MQKRIYLLIAVLGLAISTVKAQAIVYSGLSDKYLFKVNTVKAIGRDNVDKISKLVLNISDKNNKLLQQITLDPDYLFSSAYQSSDQSRSYITGKNVKAGHMDNDFGDLIIADLNFDGNEDIALKYDSGGNGGPLYSFYIRQPTGSFVKDKFLTDNMQFFPADINSKDKTLTITVHASAFGNKKTTFKYNTQIKHWAITKSTLNINK
jgi:hypothetical protein